MTFFIFTNIKDIMKIIDIIILLLVILFVYKNQGRGQGQVQGQVQGQDQEKFLYKLYRYDPEISELSGGSAHFSSSPYDTTSPYLLYSQYPYSIYPPFMVGQFPYTAPYLYQTHRLLTQL